MSLDAQVYVTGLWGLLSLPYIRVLIYLRIIIMGCSVYMFDVVDPCSTKKKHWGKQIGCMKLGVLNSNM